MEKRAKDDSTSNHTTGEHHTTGGRLSILLGHHLSNIAKEEQDHANAVEDYESQIITLKAQLARDEKIFNLKAAANETLRAELQAKVNAYTGPQHLRTKLQSDEATSKIQELTANAFSDEWIQANGLQAVATPEALKVIIAQAMTLAQRAQHLGIRITPPHADSNGAAGGAVFTAAPEQQASTAQGQIPVSPQFVEGAFTGANQ